MIYRIFIVARTMCPQYTWCAVYMYTPVYVLVVWHAVDECTYQCALHVEHEDLDVQDHLEGAIEQRQFRGQSEAASPLCRALSTSAAVFWGDKLVIRISGRKLAVFRSIVDQTRINKACS